jgi:hypothetical protein
MRLITAFFRGLLAAGLVLAAQPVMAGPKGQQFAVTANLRDGGGGLVLAYVRATDGNLSTTGPVLRLSLAEGVSQLDGGGRLSTTTVSLLAGYQFVTPQVRTKIYGGLDLQNRAFSHGGEDEGSKAGARVLVQVSEGRKSDISFNLQGSYATTHDNYQLLARVGWPTMGVTIGPEVSLIGSEYYDSRRLALSVSDLRIGALNATLRAGYASGSDEDGTGDGAFLAFGFTQQF